MIRVVVAVFHVSVAMLVLVIFPSASAAQAELDVGPFECVRGFQALAAYGGSQSSWSISDAVDEEIASTALIAMEKWNHQAASSIWRYIGRVPGNSQLDAQPICGSATSNLIRNQSADSWSPMCDFTLFNPQESAAFEAPTCAFSRNAITLCVERGLDPGDLPGLRTDRLPSLMLHELGHALGMGHSDRSDNNSSVSSVMDGERPRDGVPEAPNVRGIDLMPYDTYCSERLDEVGRPPVTRALRPVEFQRYRDTVADAWVWTRVPLDTRAPDIMGDRRIVLDVSSERRFGEGRSAVAFLDQGFVSTVERDQDLVVDENASDGMQGVVADREFGFITGRIRVVRAAIDELAGEYVAFQDVSLPFTDVVSTQFEWIGLDEGRLSATNAADGIPQPVEVCDEAVRGNAVAQFCVSRSQIRTRAAVSVATDPLSNREVIVWSNDRVEQETDAGIELLTRECGSSNAPPPDAPSRCDHADGDLLIAVGHPLIEVSNGDVVQHPLTWGRLRALPSAGNGVGHRALGAPAIACAEEAISRSGSNCIVAYAQYDPPDASDDEPNPVTGGPPLPDRTTDFDSFANLVVTQPIAVRPVAFGTVVDEPFTSDPLEVVRRVGALPARSATDVSLTYVRPAFDEPGIFYLVIKSQSGGQPIEVYSRRADIGAGWTYEGELPTMVRTPLLGSVSTSAVSIVGMLFPSFSAGR